jgi:adenylate cyclase
VNYWDHFFTPRSADGNRRSQLSNTYRNLVSNSFLDPKEYMPKVEAAVRKGLELDETLADAHAALGSFLQDSWDWAGAEREYQRAIALNSSLAQAHRNYGSSLSDMGRHDQAIAETCDPQLRSSVRSPLSY